ncbi:hypothetical protein F4774DRAFT_425421 [Daldinia eschscholtzii]|nr:hypothetical protein F4774DRAFT_425421 [Daldinia eschscholtzii]
MSKWVGTADILTAEEKYVCQLISSRLRRVSSVYFPEPLLQLYTPSDDLRLFFVSNIVRIICNQRDSRFSINDIIDDFCRESYGQVHEKIQLQLQQAVFAALGLVTFLYAASTDGYHPENFTAENAGREYLPRQCSSALADRRLFALLTKLDVLPSIGSAHSNSILEGSEELLHAWSVSYDFLSQICDINIVWTDSLNLHLHINPDSRQLFLFRFPSYCVVNLYGKASGSIFHRVLDEYNGQVPGRAHRNQEQSNSQAFLLEVIQSYRVIFCDAQSRKKFASTLRGLLESEEKVDNILVQLCEQSTVPSDSPVFSQIQDRDAYNVLHNFPILRNRLLTLKRYGMSYDPMKVRQIIRDRRHPLERLNMRVVVVFGVFSLLLGFLQVVVGTVQLVYAVRHD